MPATPSRGQLGPVVHLSGAVGDGGVPASPVADVAAGRDRDGAHDDHRALPRDPRRLESRGVAFDNGSMGFSLLFYSMPDFWLAMMLLVAVLDDPGVVPVRWVFDSERRHHRHRAHRRRRQPLFLPMITLTLGYLGEYYLVMRSSLLDVIGEEYITTIRAKGIREGRVLWGHAVRNALLPTISQIALGFGFIIGGAIAVELVFSYPGLGC